MKEFDESKIDDFLLGRMEEAELKEFKHKLSMDKDFSTLVNQRQEAIRYIGVLGDLAMKERVQKLHKEAVKNLPREKRFTIAAILKYAAAILFIVAAGYWFLQGPDSGQDIFKNNYQAYELNFGDRGTPSKDIIASAGRFYANGDYQKALEQFNTLPPRETNAKVTLAKGLCFLETGQYENAAAAFQQLIDQKDIIYEDHARWYLAMTYYKEGKEELAKKLILQIAQKEGSFNQERAKKILE